MVILSLLAAYLGSLSLMSIVFRLGKNSFIIKVFYFFDTIFAFQLFSLPVITFIPSIGFFRRKLNILMI